MYIKDEINRIRLLLTSKSDEVRNPRNKPALAEKPVIDAISEGKLNVDDLLGDLRVRFRYHGMKEKDKVVLHLIANTPGPGDFSECVTVEEVKVYSVLVPKYKIALLPKNELVMCVYFINDKETSNWTTFTLT